MKDYLKIAGNVHLSYYVEAADILGIDYEILVHRLLARFQKGEKHWFIINTVTPLTNSPSSTIAKRKYLTQMVLEKAGVPVPKQIKLQDESGEDKKLLKFWQEYEHIVVKPAQALGGHGITILPNTEQEILDAYQFALEHNKANSKTKVLGEEFVKGDHYRVLVVGDQIAGVVRRVPATVIGDGRSSIKELIEKKNKDRSEKMLKPIPIDEQTKQRLDYDNRDLDTVPNKGRIVETRFHANLTAGGITEECSQEMHQYYKDIAIQAVHAIGNKFGGVDLIAEDIVVPEKSCAVNEINYNPGLRPHYKVSNGEIIKVAVPIMEYIMNNI